MKAETRIEMEKRAIAQRRLKSCPWLLAETVAKHYLSLAMSAQMLMQVIETTRQSGICKQTIALETHILRMIRNRHTMDFGTEPNWPVDIEAFEKLSNIRMEN